MRPIFSPPLLAVFGIPAIARSQSDVPPAPQGMHVKQRLFISPMGEPFRSPASDPNPINRWFRGADTDHDGVLTNAEFDADAARFFAILDRQHDGEIDPDDIDRYETVVAPEIRAGGGYGGGERRADGRRGGGGWRGGGGGHRGDGGGSIGDGGSGNPARPGYDSIRQGAGRFGFFGYPEPVTVADATSIVGLARRIRSRGGQTLRRA